MEQITFNPNNEPYYSEDFIKGFKCGAERQFEADKSDAGRPQEWIPCSERLPIEYRTVLVTWEYAGKFYTATAFRETKNAVTYWASDGQPNYTPLNVVAWMPLPKPWEGATDGNK